MCFQVNNVSKVTITKIIKFLGALWSAHLKWENSLYQSWVRLSFLSDLIWTKLKLDFIAEFS